MRRVRLLVFLPLSVALAVTGCSKNQAAAPGGEADGPPGGGMPPLPVEAVTVRLEPLAAGLQTVGSLRADEQVVVRPEVAGRIVRIHFREGGRVVAGQPLFTLDPSTAQAAYDEALANLENSRRDAARAGELVRQKLIAQADYERARARLAVDQARAASARTALSKMTLRAPFSGQVGLREVSVGEFVNVGDALVTLVRLDPIEVDFSVPESALAQLRPGQKLTVTVDAFPGDRFDGEVVAMDPVVDSDTRSVRLRARLANPEGRLHPGQFAQLQLQSGGEQRGLLVPEQALLQQGEERYVFTIVDGKAKRTVIRTGVRVPGKVQVVAGLKPGDTVITAGQTKPMMGDGLPVQPLPAPGAVPPAAARPDAAKPRPQAN